MAEYAKHLRFTHFSLITVCLLIVITGYLRPASLLQKAQLQAETLLALDQGRVELSLYDQAEQGIAAAFPEYSRDAIVILEIKKPVGAPLEHVFSTKFNFTIPVPTRGAPTDPAARRSWLQEKRAQMDWASPNAQNGYFKGKFSNLDALSNLWNRFIGPDLVVTAKNLDHSQPVLIAWNNPDAEFPSLTLRRATMSAQLIRDTAEINRRRLNTIFTSRATVGYVPTAVITAVYIDTLDGDTEFVRSDQFREESAYSTDQIEKLLDELKNAKNTVLAFETAHPFVVSLSIGDRDGFSKSYLYPVNLTTVPFSARRNFLQKLNWIAGETVVPLTRASEDNILKVFPELFEVVGNLKSLNLAEIVGHINWLEAREKGSVSLFGVQAPTILITAWGGLVIAGISFYFALHIRAFNRFRHASDEVISFPWVGFYQGGMFESLSAYGAVFVPPLAALILPLLAQEKFTIDPVQITSYLLTLAALMLLGFEFSRLRRGL